jgi:hypothetical protein
MKGLNAQRFLIAWLSLALILAGCSSGGSGGGKPESDSPESMAKVSLSPPSSTVGQGVIFTRMVVVQNVGNTFYTAFDLVYDPTMIEYMEASEGTFLSQDCSDCTSFQVALENGEPGRLTVGLTRLGEIEEASGSGTLLSLIFKAVAPGTTTVAFANPKGFKDRTHQDVIINAWENGTITVQ